MPGCCHFGTVPFSPSMGRRIRIIQQTCAALSPQPSLQRPSVDLFGGRSVSLVARTLEINLCDGFTLRLVDGPIDSWPVSSVSLTGKDSTR